MPWQIIKNEDLEERRELGSGSFGTVYHGKWRGTDVAIKRIKKSCFTGRSSEQERLVSFPSKIFDNQAYRESDGLAIPNLGLLADMWFSRRSMTSKAWIFSIPDCRDVSIASMDGSLLWCISLPVVSWHFLHHQWRLILFILHLMPIITISTKYFPGCGVLVWSWHSFKASPPQCCGILWCGAGWTWRNTSHCRRVHGEWLS